MTVREKSTSNRLIIAIYNGETVVKYIAAKYHTNSKTIYITWRVVGHVMNMA